MQKIIDSLIFNSESFHEKLAIILGDTIKELKQKKKDQELEDTELSQNCKFSCFLEI